MRSNAVNCSRSCKSTTASRKAAKADRASGSVLHSGRPDILCAHCESTIVNPTGDQKFCNSSCMDAARYEANRPARQAAARDLYWRTHERQLANSREWRLANPEKRAVMGAARRALKFGNPGYCEVTASQWQRELNRHGNCCTYCGTSDVPMEMDHVIPLSRGGRHAIGNLTPACATCNRSKNNLLLSEWRLGRKPNLRRR